MEKIDAIYQRAAERKGGEDALNLLLSDFEYHTDELNHLTDDRVLSAFTKKVFQSGFVWHP